MEFVKFLEGINKVLCPVCRQTQHFRTETKKKSIIYNSSKGGEFTAYYEKKYAYCTVCGNEVTVPGMMDNNMRKLDAILNSVKERKQMDDILYLKFDTNYIATLFWSDNPPADPETAVRVLSINIYKVPSCKEEAKDTDNVQDFEINGGELDIQEDNETISDYIDEGLEFVDFKKGEHYNSYNKITEEEADQIIRDANKKFKEETFDDVELNEETIKKFKDAYDKYKDEDYKSNFKFLPPN